MIGALATLLFAIAGGIAYRMGGSGRYPRYFRELGQGLCFVSAMLFLSLVSWAWRPVLGTILGFGVCWGESTYFKVKIKGKTADLLDWFLVGALFGLTALPYCALTNSHWLGFGIRLVVCSCLTAWWQASLSQSVCNEINEILVILYKPKMGKDITDEFGRGFINIATLPMLLI